MAGVVGTEAATGFGSAGGCTGLETVVDFAAGTTSLVAGGSSAVGAGAGAGAGAGSGAGGAGAGDAGVSTALTGSTGAGTCVDGSSLPGALIASDYNTQR